MPDITLLGEYNFAQYKITGTDADMIAQGDLIVSSLSQENPFEIVFSQSEVFNADPNAILAQLEYQVEQDITHENTEETNSEFAFYNIIKGTAESDLFKGYDTADEFTFEFDNSFNIDGNIVTDYISDFSAEGGDKINISEIISNLSDSISDMDQQNIDSFLSASYENNYLTLAIDRDGFSENHEFETLVVFENSDLTLENIMSTIEI